MNPTLEVIHAHASVRHYTDQPVTDEQIRAIVGAGLRASTSSNLHLASVIVVRDSEHKAALAETCGAQAHIVAAPLFAVWCADRSRLDRACALRGKEQNTEYVEAFLVAAVDAAKMMQTAAIAAESMGLGICYIGAVRNNSARVIELLELPEHVFPVAGMTIGYPAKPPVPRPRLNLDSVLHWERYSAQDRPHLEAYDRQMAETGIYAGREVPDAPSAGAAVAGEPYGWMEHSARRVARPSRTELSAVLTRQGFPLR